MGANRIDNLGVDYDASKCDEVRNVFAYLDAFVNDVVAGLLQIGNSGNTKFDNQSILVRLLVEAVPQFIQDFQSTSYNSVGFIFEEQTLICVHLRLFAVDLSSRVPSKVS